MIFFTCILLVPLLVMAVAYLLSKKICYKEVIALVGVQLVVAGTSASICYYQATDDVEVWNSYVAKKDRERVSCSHSYPCNCRPSCSGSGKNRTCHQVCDTCYRHPYDYDWAVYTAIGERMEIERVDSQGTQEPKRWTAVQMGEPTSRLHSYENYVKAAPDTLFRHQVDTEKYPIPAYPSRVYDYYRLTRLVRVNGATVDDPQYWDADIGQLNAEVGSAKQTNFIVVITKDQPPDYFYALETAWIGGKKNDVILVMNLDANKKATWVNVMSWGLNPLFQVKVRDELMEKSSIERWDVIDVMKRNILQYHQRKPMSDFKYLRSSITPSVTQWVVTLLIGLAVSACLSYLFHKHEMFPEYSSRYHY
jgi:hypothetical protein